ncbi:hypothetical protein NFX46_05160 [Streptomyces phaeoluteigriseus]|uniref:Uncharacterized protein n=1 Tax=Streptomyces phaeoluteigriseus TaxID=114686 RepID=A0ABY4Z317_9ACTN|nr:hypothetical protein [Streptomyces phaeoluteigriseus]USQ83222.1 hypothetical protein NFX46_05160 [Streptomyces phaeoluteigriseus]
MEQRIGSSSQPLEGAGFDPAFIPGLTSPVTAEAKDAKPKDAKPGAAKPEDDPEDDAAVTAGDVSESQPAAAADESEGAESQDSESGEPSDGPVFEAADRRARIVADARGVRLRLDEEECEFRWEEIGAIETEVPRFGKRLTITVHTPDRRWYPIEIEATARGRFKEWDEQLDAVLDAYFDDEAGADGKADEADSD